MLNRFLKTQTTLILTLPNGHEQQIEYIPVAPADPAILSRSESAGRPGGQDVLTTFRAARKRPAAYPAGLPFVKGVRTYTNELPGSDQPPRARWAVPLRPHGTFAEVVRQSKEAGWQLDDSIRLPYLEQAARKVFLRRGGYVRRISFHKLTWFLSLVELEDVPAEIIDRLKA